ncbi:MAG: tellurite resistance/C4-dicarboxylate transporter family protein [Acidimicrobiales bacterium]
MTAGHGPRHGIETLFPGYFAMVMATGIIAIAAAQHELTGIARGLFVITCVTYGTLIVLNVARLALAPRALVTDLTSHAKGFAFLTAVAATNVLGSAAGVVGGWWDAARVLWWVSLPLWAVLLYTTLIAVVVRSDKPGLQAGINGTWFLLTVSSQSIAALGALLLGHHGGDLLAFACLAIFLLGIVLYLIVMTMVFLRWTFHELQPTETDPPAWIAAGAVAITVLAGSNLLAAVPSAPRLARLAPVIEILVTLSWATATFWFPLMVAIGVWRHVVRRVPLRYHPSFWALVFPLGMYSASTFRMRAVLGIEEGAWLAPVVLVIAGVAWVATSSGFVHRSVTSIRRSAHATDPVPPGAG